MAGYVPITTYRLQLTQFDARIKGKDLMGYRDLLGSRSAQSLFGPLPVAVLAHP